MIERPPLGDVGAVVLSYGDRVRGLDLVADLRLRAGLSAEQVLVVHNPSAPGLRLELPEGQARFLQLERNVGYAGGMNAGYAHLRATQAPAVVVMLTHDVRLGAGAITALRAALEADRHLAVAGPVLVDDEGVVWSTGKRLLPSGQFRHIKERPAEAVASRESIDGCALALRAEAVDQVAPPFDEGLFMYFEETDLCWRLRRAGWTVGVASEATATSVPGGAERPTTHAYLMTRNGLAVTARNAGRGAAARYLRAALVQAWHSLPKPGGSRFRDATQRRRGMSAVRGTVRGAQDFARGRFGAPPPDIIDGDVSIQP